MHPGIKFPWLTPHAADPSLGGVSFPGISCLCSIMSLVVLHGGQIFFGVRSISSNLAIGHGYLFTNQVMNHNCVEYLLCFLQFSMRCCTFTPRSQMSELLLHVLANCVKTQRLQRRKVIKRRIGCWRCRSQWHCHSGGIAVASPGLFHRTAHCPYLAQASEVWAEKVMMVQILVHFGADPGTFGADPGTYDTDPGTFATR